MVEAMSSQGPNSPGQPGTQALRSMAQLDMLHSLATRLNRLNDVKEIADAITAELHTIVDYHNARVYEFAADGEALLPISFRGKLTTPEFEETFEGLVTRVGEGITGHVAATGESFYTPNAIEVSFAVTIPGTDDVDESIVAVPLRYGDRVTGVIVLSKLGVDQFDEEDMRLLEVLAGHASVAFENARLFQLEREAAETSAALLGLSQALTRVHGMEDVLGTALETIPEIIPCSALAAYVRDPESGAFGLVRERGLDAVRIASSPTGGNVDAKTGARFLLSVHEPFVLGKEIVEQVPPEYRLIDEVREVLVAPLRWDPDGFGAITMIAPEVDASFSDDAVRISQGIADITSLALGTARRFHELERFHDLVEGLDAVFWEADGQTLELSFLSRRAGRVLRTDASGWVGAGTRWGDHVHPDDREIAVASVIAAALDGRSLDLEYRVIGASEEIIWVRDLVHPVRGAQVITEYLRGLMVDITERKRAEQALRESERKASEAFRREREAARELRALDEMKNTFLEAVSHDLRTPLTSILGSALTLERSELKLPAADAVDLVSRIAVNARKLERLLSDLLDLDRLQRGIVSPQLRRTDVADLVRRTVEESQDLLEGRPLRLELASVVVPVDAAKVERILENLFANAVRHTPSGTPLWVRLEEQDGGALISVEDKGPGVAPDMREVVFEPFRQAPGSANHSPGVGIGLSLVRRFAELHEGRAWIEERQGGGASFKVLLPGAPAPSPTE